MRKPPNKGKLLHTQWIPITGGLRCYTCLYHDQNSTTPATSMKINTYESVVQKVYYCDVHAVSCKNWDNLLDNPDPLTDVR